MKQQHSDKKVKKPWATKAVMEQIYELNFWGTNDTDFYSGDGSHHAEIVNPYVAIVRSFLTSFDKKLTVCDLGCGDFNVGKQLTAYAQKYIAVDIVEALIARNRKKFQVENLEFHCLNLTEDSLPVGDCALVRQVLQHLSNAEIERIVRKLEKYHYVILTEHLPVGDFIPNKDIISGRGIRLKQQSGIDLLAAPFYLKVKEATPFLSVVPNDGKGVIVTTLYKTL
ncbi:class I SAM-dependent methyltransferase [Kordia jejudonensis]|uniref:class I SAM-dependent methyltransferase n=1 Tax=Kordia jejudonensis TaxID=1348245 RepID=UPI0006298906|nr:class I SAM-dependent methyltransferase [Kordia jejudonensis]